MFESASIVPGPSLDFRGRGDSASLLGVSSIDTFLRLISYVRTLQYLDAPRG